MKQRACHWLLLLMSLSVLTLQSCGNDKKEDVPETLVEETNLPSETNTSKEKAVKMKPAENDTSTVTVNAASQNDATKTLLVTNLPDVTETLTVVKDMDPIMDQAETPKDQTETLTVIKKEPVEVTPTPTPTPKLSPTPTPRLNANQRENAHVKAGLTYICNDDTEYVLQEPGTKGRLCYVTKHIPATGLLGLWGNEASTEDTISAVNERDHCRNRLAEIIEEKNCIAEENN